MCIANVELALPPLLRIYWIDVWNSWTNFIYSKNYAYQRLDKRPTIDYTEDMWNGWRLNLGLLSGKLGCNFPVIRGDFWIKSSDRVWSSWTRSIFLSWLCWKLSKTHKRHIKFIMSRTYFLRNLRFVEVNITVNGDCKITCGDYIMVLSIIC